MSSHQYCTSVSDVRVGDRVELHPATDMWMRGARVGEVIATNTKYVRIRLDALPTRTCRVDPTLLRVIQRTGDQLDLFGDRDIAIPTQPACPDCEGKRYIPSCDGLRNWSRCTTCFTEK